jgi:hypothetical protein
MSRQKAGQILFWFGVVNVVVMQALTWFQTPMQRVHTAGELSGTVYAVDGALWWIRMIAASGLTLSIMGVLLAIGKKGSYFWLLGFLPGTVISAGMYWAPSHYMPELFGIGGAVILLSYFGILWLSTRPYAAYECVARTGRHLQLLGHSFLVSTAFLLCLHFGNPHLLALADYPIPSAESIIATLSLGMVLLFVGQYLSARSLQDTTTRPQEACSPQSGTARPERQP